MPKPKQQPEQDQISVADPNDPDVIAYSAAGSLAANEQPCDPGYHWDPVKNMCVRDDEEPVVG